MQQHRLADRVVLVTGAGSGIGRASARLAAAEGARVAVADVDAESARETAAAIVETHGGAPLVLEADVSDEASVAAMVARTLAGLGGRIDVLANVAGAGSVGSAPETSAEEWERVFAVNARGTFLACKHVLPAMEAQGGGAIVNVGSVAGLVGLPGRAAYCASKGAVIALTRALAVDHVAARVRVNCVCPGTVDSPWLERLIEDAGESRDELVARQPMGRLGRPEEIAEAIVYLASDAAAFMTGSVQVIDGGLTAA